MPTWRCKRTELVDPTVVVVVVGTGTEIVIGNEARAATVHATTETGTVTVTGIGPGTGTGVEMDGGVVAETAADVVGGPGQGLDLQTGRREPVEESSI